MSATRTPSTGTVAFAQLQLLLRFMYPLAVIVILLLGTLAYYHSVWDGYEQLPPWRTWPAAASLTGYLAIIGLVAALMTWVNESPRKRRYHYSLPVGHVKHNLLRLAAGAGWLFVAVVVFCFVLAFVEDPLIFKHWLLPSAVFWFAVFAVPLLTYLLGSILAVAFEWAVVWLVCVIGLVVVLEFDPVEKAVPQVTEVQRSIVAYREPRSLLYAVMGFAEHSAWVRSHAARLQVFERSANAFYATGPSPQYVGSKAQEHAQLLQWSGRDFKPQRNWFEALLIWYALAVGGLALALMRKPIG